MLASFAYYKIGVNVLVCNVLRYTDYVTAGCVVWSLRLWPISDYQLF